jgi:hypothetical protein
MIFEQASNHLRAKYFRIEEIFQCLSSVSPFIQDDIPGCPVHLIRFSIPSAISSAVLGANTGVVHLFVFKRLYFFAP